MSLSDTDAKFLPENQQEPVCFDLMIVEHDTVEADEVVFLEVSSADSSVIISPEFDQLTVTIKDDDGILYLMYNKFGYLVGIVLSTVVNVTCGSLEYILSENDDNLTVCLALGASLDRSVIVSVQTLEVTAQSECNYVAVTGRKQTIGKNYLYDL